MAAERMSILYDQSVEEKALILGTSNKTELLIGYGTIHGDMACAINPMGDLLQDPGPGPGKTPPGFRQVSSGNCRPPDSGPARRTRAKSG